MLTDHGGGTKRDAKQCSQFAHGVLVKAAPNETGPSLPATLNRLLAGGRARLALDQTRSTLQNTGNEAPVRLWPLTDIASCAAHVRYQG